MKMTSKLLALVIFVILFGGIALTSGLNWWRDGSAKGSGIIEGKEDAGEVNTERVVTGSTTFQELLDWGIPEADIERIMGGKIPAPGMGVRDYLLEKGIEFRPYKEQLQQALERGK